MNKLLQDPLRNLKLENLYMSRDIPHLLGGNMDFELLNFSLLAVLCWRALSNGKSRNVNIGGLSNLLDILKAENTPINIWGRKAKPLFSEELLPDLQWQKLQKNAKREKLCTNIQPLEVSTKPISFMLMPKEVSDVQDAGKPSEPVTKGLHIDSNLGRNSH